MHIPRKLCIGLSLAITWLTGNGWRRPDSRVEDIHSPDFYAGIARQAEQAHLDFLFRPDALFLDPQVLAHSPGFSSLDPTVLLASIARETRRIGLVTTASTSFYPPFVVARQLQSLNLVSQGRAGWNIVTSLDGNQNFGVDQMPPSTERYDRALEFTEVVRRLWQSYPREALLIDRAAGRYADAEQVQSIDHVGRHFRVKGPLNLPEHAAGAIPLFQAGASDAGRDFAARVADAIFAASPDIEAGVELRRDLRERTVRHGRGADAVRVLPGLSLYLGRTVQEARDLYRETHAQQNLARKHAYLRDTLGIDISTLRTDRRITADLLPAADRPVRSRTHADLLRRFILREQPTVEVLLARPEVVGSAHWIVVGTADDALREIIARVEAGSADGFIALPGGSLQSLQLFFGELMPRLVGKGLFRSEYAGTTLREHLLDGQAKRR